MTQQTLLIFEIRWATCLKIVKKNVGYHFILLLLNKQYSFLNTVLVVHRRNLGGFKRVEKQQTCFWS